MAFKLDTPFMETFEELNRLTEATNIYASRRFWDAAKNKKLDDEAFHAAFDDELKDLGLMDIFNTDGTLTSQSVYGKIKNAKDANPDSWTIKALLKMWVLQFKDNVKPESQIRREKAEADRLDREAKLAAKKEQERIELETKYAAAKESWDILNENFLFIQEVVDETAKEYAITKKAILKPDLEKAVSLKADIGTVTRGIIKFYNNSEEATLARLTKEDDLIKVVVTLGELHPRYPMARVLVEVQQFFGDRPSFRYQGKTAANRIDLTVEDIDEDIIKSKVLSLLDEIWELVGPHLNTLATIQGKHEAIMSKVTMAKAAQSAVSAGKPVDSNFISDILAEFARGRKAAKDAFDFYADTQDGSSGAAYAMAEYETLVAVGTYLVNCNWRALIKDREIASWRVSETVNDLENALAATFKAFSNDLVIEIIK